MELWRHDLTITPQYLERHRVFKALEGDELAGMCAVEDHDSLWVLEHVWVDPAHQRKGVGRALVRHALDLVRELRPGILRLAADPHASEFYLRLGAQPCGARSAPMPGAPDRVIPLFEFAVNAGLD
jgi:GNAT superfamily N-acetyltransferase